MNNHHFNWFSKITIVDDDDEVRIDTKRLIAAIEKYGVNKTGKFGERLIHYLSEMEEEHIDIVLSYKPDFIYDGVLHVTGFYTNNHCYILQKILENDVEYRFISYSFQWWSGDIYKNIYAYACDPNRSAFIKERACVLVSNHRNKGITLFELMLEQLN